ncbi:hypothetical protein O6H91_Y392300 [Diphasiastrum complanatum]|nr:hypothetical protein O6H91_Y392300 [Diphasiastrum complanatum]KAJ7277060.1 hypothetical protein O6H91_Y392300 [Diphasiastrum complanatum]
MLPSRSPERVIMSRDGSVLGKKTILKSDHFPGCQNKRLQPTIEGAPNYRQVESLDIYGVAIPTIAGIRRVLNLVGANRSTSQMKVLWHNLREEPVVYVNGRPFVLREVQRPFTNLEYTVWHTLKTHSRVQFKCRILDLLSHLIVISYQPSSSVVL